MKKLSLQLFIRYYRPQRSCGQGNIFAPVCHSVHRGASASVHAGIPLPQSTPPWEHTPPSPRADTPQEQTPPQSRHPREQTPQSRHPPGIRHPPGSRHPPEQTPLLWSRQPPPPKADSGIRSMSGRYTSYWNAFLFVINFNKVKIP